MVSTMLFIVVGCSDDSSASLANRAVKISMSVIVKRLASLDSWANNMA